MAAQERPSHLEQVVRDARQALETLGSAWALIGGLAVSARAEPRFTRDADFAVAVAGDHEAEALIRELLNLVVKWDLENDAAMKGRANRRILELIAQLRSEDLL